MQIVSNGVARTLKKLRTSKEDCWIKQRFSSVATLFKMRTSLKGNNLLLKFPEGVNSFLYEQFLLVWKITFITLSDLPWMLLFLLRTCITCVIGATPMVSINQDLLYSISKYCKRLNICSIKMCRFKFLTSWHSLIMSFVSSFYDLKSYYLFCCVYSYRKEYAPSVEHRGSIFFPLIVAICRCFFSAWKHNVVQLIQIHISTYHGNVYSLPFL